MSIEKNIYLGPWLEVVAPGCSKHDIYEWTGGVMHAEDGYDEDIFVAMPNLLKPESPRPFVVDGADSLVCCEPRQEEEEAWLLENYKQAIEKIKMRPEVQHAEIQRGLTVWYS